MSSLSPTSSMTDIAKYSNKQKFQSLSPVDIPDEGEELRESLTSVSSLENSLIKTNRQLNHQVVTLKNKQQELIFHQNKLAKNLQEKEDKIGELNTQLNTFLNEENYDGNFTDYKFSLKKDDFDNQSVKSNFSTSMYSVKSLMGNDNDSISSIQNGGKDPNKLVNILVNQRDMLKQKLKSTENIVSEANKKLDLMQIDNYKLKQQIEQLTINQKRSSSVISQNELKKILNLDLEGQMYSDDRENGEYIVNSRKYSSSGSKFLRPGFHNYIENLFLRNKFRRGAVINYFLILHLILVVLLLVQTFKRTNSSIIIEDSASTLTTASNLPPSGGKVMHAPGKGNAEQAAKNPLQ
ncbi:hypothetical protein QEN19_002838 [Hanseniaspora menglaensis]